MTSGDYGEGQDYGAAPSYPVIFGITFTPLIIGVLLALAGLGATLLLVLQVVVPKNDEVATLQGEVTDLQNQVKTKEQNRQKLKQAQTDLEAATKRRDDVLTLFSSETTLNTLLLDLNREFTKRRATLSSFTPDPQPTVVVNDSSLGPAVNGKLKRKEITINMVGTFTQTQGILRSIEQLQPLIVVKGFKSQLDRTTQKITVNSQGKVVSGGNTGEPDNQLKTSFKLQALFPLTPEESAALVAPPPAALAAPPPKK